MVKTEKWYMIALSYIVLSIGVFIMSVGINYFFAPNTIAPGGVTGFAVVIERMTNIPIYITNLVINIPLFILGAKTLGRSTAIKTLYCTLILSLFLKILPPMGLTHDLLLSSIFGGVLAGVGLGLVFKSGGTTGGTDLAGAVINRKFPNLSLPTAMMLIDLMVVSFAGIVEKNIEISLYSVIAMFATVKVIDLILEGVGYLKGFYIITSMPDEVGERLMLDLDRGVTSLQGKGMYTKEQKEVLLCVVNRSQFTQVKEIVKEIDPNAFVMVTEMYEVLGEGFSDTK
jgi:uncharacterized membrane-anchored protein YitT (DUF2179 family)